MGRLIFTFLMILGLGSALPAAASKNNLASEVSPYLRLHATDPVFWRPWGAEALMESEKTGRPILLSIGYLACYWCHVMQEESYTDTTTAALINARFIPVLIDREERPDLDHAFQHAALVMNLPTGWPLTLFLTSEGKPFWGGTYFPQQSRAGMAPFTKVLANVADAYADNPRGIARNAAGTSDRLAALSRPQPGSVSTAILDRVAMGLLAMADPFVGGFGDVAKFPQTSAHELLWWAYLRTGDVRYKEAVVRALSHMVAGGLMDHVGGGFFRYTVDPLWHTPHFEKMLDTNATILRLLAAVWAGTSNPMFKIAAERTVAFLQTEMRLPDGAYASALDAVSRAASGKDEEGAYYLWRQSAVTNLLGDDAPAFFSVFGLAPPENLADIDIGLPYRLDPEAPQPVGETVVARWMETLKIKRDARLRPRRDEKVLADWNGMTIRALAEAGSTFDRADWIEAGRQAFDAVTKRLMRNGRLHQSAVEMRVSSPATAAGLAMMASAALSLFEVTGERSYLDRAIAWSKIAMARHWDSRHTGFFAGAEDSGPTPQRTKALTDTPNVGGTPAMMDVMARLDYLTGDRSWGNAAAATMRAYAGMLDDIYPGIAGFANASETILNAVQIVIVGRRGEPDTNGLLRASLAAPLGPRTLQVVAPGEELPEGHPARFKGQINDRATAYVCRGQLCSLPVIAAAELRQTLEAMVRSR